MMMAVEQHLCGGACEHRTNKNAGSDQENIFWHNRRFNLSPC